MKKTKIIATIGPASKDENTLKELIVKGMDIARINMAYASYEFAESTIKKINQLNDELKKSVSIMLDLKGPDLNIAKFNGGTAYFTTGTKIRIYDEPTLGDSTKFSVNCSKFVSKVKTNTTLKLDDGRIELYVIDKTDEYLLCEVKVGGFIEDGKGINLIDQKLNLPFMSQKDMEDIEFANKMNVDFLALSFPSSGEDILEINDFLIGLKNDHISLIAKIENQYAIDDMDAIINNSDGIMIARGDLGVEIPLERVPGIQKQIINKCHRMGKVSIVATEMMMTMANKERPSRAEVSDVANAVLEGVDAVMLCGETTVGKYPVLTLETMVKIITSAEQDLNYYEYLDRTMRTEKQDISGNICYSTVESSNRLKCKLIMTPTITGYTAKKISRFRPISPIIALTPNKDVLKELTMYYGIYPVLIGEVKTFDKMMRISKEEAKKYADKNDLIIITGGYPFSEVKHTNFMKIEEI